jgi:hypothetical protein
LTHAKTTYWNSSWHLIYLQIVAVHEIGRALYFIFLHWQQADDMTGIIRLSHVRVVVDYFRAAGGFTNYKTVSYHDRPRPEDDLYYPGRITADPVYIVAVEKSH